VRTAPTSVNVGGSLVDELGRDYKEFKKLHPERTARIPLAIKQKAKDVLDGGSTLGDIAKATGLAIPTVTVLCRSILIRKSYALLTKS
jgi:hypothetical protein